VSRPLPQVLASLGAPPVVVVGDVLLDRYETGVVERISPEAPVPVLRVESETERLGGAASVATFTAVLGAPTTLVGVAGEDEPARKVRAIAKELGIALELVAVSGRRTGVKTRHLARTHSFAQQVLRVDAETVSPVDGAAEAAMTERLGRVVPRAKAILLSDYGKGALTPTLLRSLIDAGRRAKVPVVVDPKGVRYERYRGATVLTPNRSETLEATGVRVVDAASAERAATALVRDVGLDAALITLDRDGMYLKVGDAPGAMIPTTPREVFDVTGAGDMVAAVLAVALAGGASLAEAAALANVAAGLEVERVGVVPVTREEIAARLATGLDAAQQKHVPRAEAAAFAARHRAAGRRVVFTNGCFDVLHAGHVRFLAAARAEGDVLVLGLNADASVRRLKGDGRPVNAEADRIEVLAALATVDAVVVFDEDTPLRLIEDVQPDVLAKGADWADKGVVGRDVVEARGGRVVLIPLHPGRSTTETLRRTGGRSS
jgi:D-beta-D-heptose 7-phosphate kinase/D-beta-D-heptose 1-phosphate adenosyltransferase